MAYKEKKNEKRSNTSTSKRTGAVSKKEINTDSKQEEPKVRYLKVQPFLREKRIDFFTNVVRIVPQLRLCGDWLEAAGFSPDEYVSVTVLQDLLIIRSSKQGVNQKTE